MKRQREIERDVEREKEIYRKRGSGGNGRDMAGDVCLTEPTATLKLYGERDGERERDRERWRERHREIHIK